MYLRCQSYTRRDQLQMQHADFTITKASGQPRKPRNQAEFRSVYIADLTRAAEANGVTLSNLTRASPRCLSPLQRHALAVSLLRKSFDADCRRLRRQAGVPAVSGPPIPGSERTGHRRWRTLADSSHPGRQSAVARRDQAMPRWQRIARRDQALPRWLRDSDTCTTADTPLRDIARQVGLSPVVQVGTG